MTSSVTALRSSAIAAPVRPKLRYFGSDIFVPYDGSNSADMTSLVDERCSAADVSYPGLGGTVLPISGDRKPLSIAGWTPDHFSAMDLTDGSGSDWVVFPCAFWDENDASTATEGEEEVEDEQTSIRERLLTLATAAVAERIEPSRASYADLLRFLTTHPGVKRPGMFLLDNGNYRAVWKNNEGEQIGLQFRGNDEIQFVIFARREHPPMLSRAAGRDSFRGVERQMDASGIRRLMYP